MARADGLVVSRLGAVAATIAAVSLGVGAFFYSSARDTTEAQTPPAYLNGSWTASGLPGMRLSVQTALVSPSSSDLATVYGASPSSPAAPAESDRIEALSRALEYDVDRIYQFVRNSIVFEPQFGLHKGADGVLLDGAGGAFDQSHLMVSLLRAADIPARYVYGTVTLGSEASSILKVTSASQACYLLAAAGTPATVNGSTTCASLGGSVSTVVMRHVWVEAQIGGTWYAFDPSLKLNEQIAGLNIWSEINTNGSAAWSTASSGGLSGINAATLNGHLEGWATALEDKLAEDHHDKSLKQVVGGWDIIPTEAEPRVAAIAHQTSVAARWTGDVPTSFRAKLRIESAGFDQTFDLPSIYGFRIQAQQAGALKVVIRKEDHLRVSHAYFVNMGPGNYACDNEILYCGTTPTTGQWTALGNKLRLTIDHPYAARRATGQALGTFADETTTKRIETGNRVDVVVRTGGGVGWRKAKWAAENEANVAERIIPAGMSYDCAHPTGGQQINVGDCEGQAEDWRYWNANSGYFADGEVAVAEMATKKDQLVNTWADYFDEVIGVVEPLTQSRIFHQHSIGIAITPGNGQNVLDIDTAVGVSAGGTDQPHVTLSAIASLSVTGEGLALVQNHSERPMFNGQTTVSTAASALSVGSSLHQLTAPGQTASLPGTVSAATKAQIETYLTNGFDVVANGSIGDGFMARREDGSEIAWILVGSSPEAGVTPFRKGAETERPDPMDHMGKAEGRALAANVAGTQLGAVDLRTGALSFSEGTELTFGQGDFPYMLGFSRSYASGGSVDGGGSLGMGWSHNWESSVSHSTDIMALFPDADVVSASPMLVTALIAVEAGRSSSLAAPVISGVATNWLQSVTAGNVTTVSGGGATGRFVRRADGETWRNPASPRDTLNFLGNGGVYDTQVDWTRGDLSVMKFRDIDNPSPPGNNGNDGGSVRGGLTEWTFPSGVVITLSYAVNTGADGKTNPVVLQSVQNNLGAQLIFTHGTNPTEQTQSECMALAETQADKIYHQQLCQDAARVGSQLWKVKAGPDEINFGYLPECPINTNYCSVKLITAARPGLRTRNYSYTDNAGVENVLVSVSDTGVTTPRARFVWDAKFGQVAPHVTVAYDAADRPTTYFPSGYTSSAAKDATNAVVRQTYDVDGRLIASADAMGRTSRADYDGVGRTIWMQSAYGDTSEFEYDWLGNLTETTRRPIADCATGRTSDEQDWWCQTITVRAEYHATWHKPTKVFLPATAADPVEREWTMTYNAKGLLETQKGPAVPDPNNNNTPTRPEWRVWYDAYGRPVRTRDPVGIEAVMVWGGGGLPNFCLRQTKESAQTGGLNLTTNQLCDAVGNVTSVTTPRGHTTTTTYDALRRKTQTLGPSGTNIKTQWVYDLDGRLIEEKMWDQAANTWRSATTTYSATGQTLTVTDPAGDLSRTCYDAVDRPIAVIDPEGRAAKTEYNAAGQPTAIHRWYRAGSTDPCSLVLDLPTGQTESRWRRYQYNAAGMQVAEIDARGNAISARYDGLGRPAKTIFADNSEAWLVHDQRGQAVLRRQRSGSFAGVYYDAMGRDYQVREYAAGDGALDWKGRNTRAALDLAGRPVWRDVSNQTTTTSTFDNTLVRDLRNYGYDVASRLTSDRWRPEGTSGSVDLTLSYQYDADSNRTRITWPDAQFAAYTYDAAGRPITASFGGRTATRAYDSLSRLTSVTRTNGTSSTYTYEIDSDLATLTHAFASGSTPGSATWGFTSDASAKVTGITISAPVLGWTPPTNYGRTYGAASNLNQVTSENGVPVTWNTEGNMTSDGVNTYSWTYGNRMMGASRVGMTATYDYDSDDRRTKKTVNGVVTRTMWSGADEVGEYNAAGTLVRRFVPDGTGGMDARLMTVEAGGTAYWHHTDRQGSVVATSSSAGQVVATATYSPHGEFGTGVTAPPTGSPFGYTGRQYDPETGLYQYRARYYSPRLGVFLSIDPIGTKDDPNLYLYVGNDPVNLTDPTGMVGCPTFGNIECPSAANAETRRQQREFRQEVRVSERRVRGELVQIGSEWYPVVSEVGAVTDFIREPSVTGGLLLATGLLPGPDLIGQRIRSLERGARRLERNAADHRRRAEEFRERPTVRPGMEGRSPAEITRQQEARASHLEREAAEFESQASRMRREAEDLRAQRR